MGAERVTDPADLSAAYDRMLASDKPYLLDVSISRDQNVYPMVAPGAGLNDVIGAIDIGGRRCAHGRRRARRAGAFPPDFVVQGDDDKEGGAR